ncbi:glycosylhydrolase-like jelly roll fold domain-containing protein [Flavobacterium faecale]|uniref:glycosylhydrolase-like jelly roll fold domain-containing protein n=1 Tax=Flavobacterium faecale TaxID=1355330 RepID=UPI003AAB64AC
MVDSGVYEIPVNESFLEGNEILTKKSLRLEYATNDEVKTITVSDGGLLKLTEATAEPQLIYNQEKLNWITPWAGKLKYKTATGKTKTLKVKSVPEAIELKGAWEVSFPMKNKTVLKESFNNLTSWATAANDDIRYFSGTAIYKKQFDIPAHLLKEEYSLQLDLGTVKEIAEVLVNGKNLGVYWKAPFSIDINKLVVAGNNTLEIKITNLWPNRLIGDEQLPLDYERKGPNVSNWPDWLLNNSPRPTDRSTFAAFKHWHKDSKLLPSGLLGPVKIIVSKVAVLK